MLLCMVLLINHFFAGKIKLTGCLLLGQDKRNDKSVQTQSFGENENEDVHDVEALVLANGADTSITNNTNS